MLNMHRSAHHNLASVYSYAPTKSFLPPLFAVAIARQAIVSVSLLWCFKSHTCGCCCSLTLLPIRRTE